MSLKVLTEIKSDIYMENSSLTSSKPVVLVTGASGLIGKRVIDRLADKYQCVGLDKAGDPMANKKAENISVSRFVNPNQVEALVILQFSPFEALAKQG